MSQNRKTGSTANGLPVKTMLPYFLSVTEAVKHQNQPFLGVFFAALLRYFGHCISAARKLCLQLWAQRLQTLLYCRLPFLPKKKDHSIFQRLLLLISTHPLWTSPLSFPALWACAPHIPFSPHPAFPGRRAFPPAFRRARLCCRC